MIRWFVFVLCCAVLCIVLYYGWMFYLDRFEFMALGD